MPLYQFQIWGRYFAVDTKSGNFFELDPLASQALSLLEKDTRLHAKKALLKQYPKDTVEATFKNIAVLEKKMCQWSAAVPSFAQPKRRITDLTLNVVNTCNLRCRYCWNEAGAYSTKAGEKKKMTPAIARQAVDLLVKESGGARDLVVDFYGGEPLMNFDLIKDTIEYCRSISRKKKITFRFLLATNGTLLDRAKGSYLIDNGVDIAVSLDGDRSIQDKQRPFPDGRGSFDALTSNLSALNASQRNRIVGRATFTPYSTDTIKTFNFLRGLGFDRIEVCESEQAGYGLESRNNFFFSGTKGLAQLKAIYEKLARFYTAEVISGSLDYHNTYFNRFFKQLSRLYHIQSIVGTCSAGFSLMAVDMDGTIYPCTAFVGVAQFSIGTTRKGIEESRIKKFFSAKISSSKECLTCWARRICRGCGSCYNLNYFTNKDAGKPDPYYCELFRYKTKLMIAMIAEINHNNPDRLQEVLVPEYYVTRGRKAVHAN